MSKYYQIAFKRALKQDLIAGTQVNLCNKLGSEEKVNPIEVNNGTYYTQAEVKDAVPMVASIDIVPSIGDNGEGNSTAINGAMSEYYTLMRSHNASLSSYTPLDVFKMSFALANLDILADMTRRRLLAATIQAEFLNNGIRQGINNVLNYGDLTEVEYIERNYANLISEFNKIADSAAALRFPKEFAIGRRWHNLFSNVFAEDPEMTKTQFIIARAEAIWRLDQDPTSYTVGQLKAQSIATSTSTCRIDNWIALLRDMVNELTTDSEVNNIAAELMKASMDTGYRIEPIKLEDKMKLSDIKFSMDFLDYVRNATYVGDAYDYDTQYIYEFTSVGTYPFLAHYCDDSGISSNYQRRFYIDGNWYVSEMSSAQKHFSTTHGNSLIFTHSDTPSNEEGYNAVAGHCDIENIPAMGVGLGSVINQATEICLRFNVHWYDASTRRYADSSINTFMNYFGDDYDYSFGSKDCEEFLTYQRKFTSFSCMPVVYVIIVRSNNAPSIEIYYNNVDNLSVIANTTIDKVQEIAIQSCMIYSGSE